MPLQRNSPSRGIGNSISILSLYSPEIEWKSNENTIPPPHITIFESALYRTTSTVFHNDDLILIVDPNWLPGEVQAVRGHVDQIKKGYPLYLLFTHSDYDHIIAYRFVFDRYLLLAGNLMPGHFWGASLDLKGNLLAKHPSVFIILSKIIRASKNMKKHLRLYPTLLLLAVLWCLNSSVSFSQDIEFERIPNELGLSQNLISALWQDRQGFLWVGTKDGLNRFDGYHFQVFQHDPFDSTSISDNNIKTILEDRHGRLWVGTTNGLNLLGRKTETFQRFFPKNNLRPSAAAIVEGHPGLSGQNINSLLEDREGNIWVGTVRSGVVKMEMPPGPEDLDKIKYTVFRATEAEESLWENPVKQMALDEEGAIWVHSREQLCLIRQNENGKGYTIRRLLWPNFNPQWPGYQQEDFLYIQQGEEKVDHRFYSIFNDERGAVWMISAGGFAKWLPGQKRFKLFPLNVNLEEYSIPPLLGLEGVSGFIDRKGQIWANGMESLVVYDTLSHRIVERQHIHDESSSTLSQSGFRSMLEDTNGNIWVGTNGNGLCIYNPNKKRFSGQAEAICWQGESLRAICQARNGTVWLGTASRKLLRLNLATGKIRPVVLKQADWPRSFDAEFDQVYAIQEGRSGNIWVAASRGLFRFREEPGGGLDWDFFKIYQNEGSFPNVFDLHLGPAGKIWLLTHFEFGQFDPATGQFNGHNYLHVSGGKKERGGNFPCIFQQKNGLFWLGTKRGLIQFDPVTETFSFFGNDPKDPNSLSHPLVKCIQADPSEPERVLWVGTGGGGLNRFDLQTGRFTHFKKKDGLPDNVIYSILDDAEGNFWLSTNQGLARFNPRTGLCKNYGVESGLQDNEFNSGAYFKSADGRLFFGGIGGFNAFLPSAVKDREFVPPIVITGFKLANRHVDFKAADSPLKQAISQARELTLTWKDNIFSFEFAALDFTEPSQNQYAYRLEGFSDEWQYIGTQRSATFTNIDPGEYTFRVKGTSHDGAWNEEGASLKITILPPWWNTWWAFLSYALLFGAAAFSFYKFQLNRQMEKAEARKIKEMDALKTRLYTNITHEFRTPLTVIMGVSSPAAASSPSPLDEGGRGLIYRNAKNLLRLVNQLLDLSKLESGILKPEYVQADIIPYLEYLTESFSSMAAEKSIRLLFYPEMRSLVMDFDEAKIQHIVYNLLSNALKFTEPGGKVVLHAHQELQDEQALLKLKVSDTGLGIPEDELPHIFDRFFQVDSDKYRNITRPGEGTGIGLALAKELVELMGGSISVKSLEGIGTDFTVLLPVKKNAAVRQPGSPAAGRNVHVEPSGQNAVHEKDTLNTAEPEPDELDRLLLIEDNRDVATYLISILEKDYQVVTAEDGQAGIEKALELIPDIIISDVMMPRKDGFEVCRALKLDERTSHIPIILLTAKAEEEAKIQGLRTGADAYLKKPFNREELFVRLEKLLELRKQLQKKYAQAGATSTADSPPSAAEPTLDDLFMQKFQQAIEMKMGQSDFGLEGLCKMLSMSRTQLYRKAKALTGESPVRFIQKVRLNKARELLRTTELNVSEIAYEVGFADPAYFSRAFNKEFGAPPSSIRK